MKAFKVGVVGARRHHQGIGHHVARHLMSLGAEVRAIVGTRPETLAEATAQLERFGRLHVRGYLSLAEMLDAEQLDAVAICSPYSGHRQQLEACLAAGVHVLCEKPLVCEPGRSSGDDAEALVEAFADNGQLLMVNEQWPYTLPAFLQLWPSAFRSGEQIETFEMLLGPSATGTRMIPDALPHVMSLLIALTKHAGTVERPSIEAASDDPGDLSRIVVRFHWQTRDGSTAVTAHLRKTPCQPRAAGFAINGCGVRRLIDPDTYAMCFEALETETDELETGRRGAHLAQPPLGRRVPLADPLVELLRDFLRRIPLVERAEDPDMRVVAASHGLDVLMAQAEQSLGMSLQTQKL